MGLVLHPSETGSAASRSWARWLPAVLVAGALLFMLGRPPSSPGGDASWDLFLKTQAAGGAGGGPLFSDSLRALEGQRVRLMGFVMPLEQGRMQRRFLLSAYPMQGCSFCAPGGPEAFIEVQSAEPVPFSYDPVTLAGTLHLTADPATGVFYQLTEARIRTRR